MILVALFYAAVGVTFAIPANHVRMWRLAAWVVSGVAFLAHAGYERLRLHRPAVSAALRVAFAAGLGALGLAIAANVHFLLTASASGRSRLLLVALVVWPLITGVPAFLAGLGVSGLFARIAGRVRVE